MKLETALTKVAHAAATDEANSSEEGVIAVNPNPYLTEYLARQVVADVERAARHAWLRVPPNRPTLMAALLVAASAVAGLVWMFG